MKKVGAAILIATMLIGVTAEAARSPTWKCTKCGAFHGGSASPTLCPQCAEKEKAS